MEATEVTHGAGVRACSTSLLSRVLRKWFSHHIKHFFPVKFNIFVPVSGFKTISYCTFMSNWLFSGKKKEKEKYEKHFCSLGALSKAEGSTFISPPLLLLRNWKAGAVTCVYTLWSLFSPLLPRMSSLRTGADCLCLGPGKVAEGECVQRRG